MNEEVAKHKFFVAAALVATGFYAGSQAWEADQILQGLVGLNEYGVQVEAQPKHRFLNDEYRSDSLCAGAIDFSGDVPCVLYVFELGGETFECSTWPKLGGPLLVLPDEPATCIGARADLSAKIERAESWRWRYLFLWPVLTLMGGVYIRWG